MNYSDLTQIFGLIKNTLLSIINLIQKSNKKIISKKIIRILKIFKLLRPNILYKYDAFYKSILHIKDEGLIIHLIKNEFIEIDIFNKWQKYVNEQNIQNLNTLLESIDNWWINLSFLEECRINKYLNIILKKLQKIRKFYSDRKLIKKDNCTNYLIYNDENINIFISNISFHLTNDFEMYRTQGTNSGSININLMDDDLLDKNYKKFLNNIKKKWIHFRS